MPAHNTKLTDFANADLTWFRENPDRSFRVQVMPNAEVEQFLAARDGFGSATFLKGEAIVISFWRFTSDTTKALDHAIIPSAPGVLRDAAQSDQDSDSFALHVLFGGPLGDISGFVRPEDIVLRGPTDVIFVTVPA